MAHAEVEVWVEVEEIAADSEVVAWMVEACAAAAVHLVIVWVVVDHVEWEAENDPLA